MDIKPIETYYNGYRFRSRLEARWAVFFDALGVEYEYEPEGFDLGNGLYYLPDFRVKCWGTRGEINDKPFDLWIEVKGKMTTEETDKIIEFSKAQTKYSMSFDDGEHDWCPHGVNWCEVKMSPHSDYDDHCRRWECVCGLALGKVEDGPPGPFICPRSKGKGCVHIGEILEITNPILIVGNIPPKGKSSDSWAVHAYEIMDGCGIYPFNYELIDGDYFAAYPAAYHGKFFLWGDDSNYIWNKREVEEAYDKARQARFEHGETQIIKRQEDIYYGN